MKIVKKNSSNINNFQSEGRQCKKILFLFFIFLVITVNIALCQENYQTTYDYKTDLLRQARKLQEDFHRNQAIEDKYDLLLHSNKYLDLYYNLSDDPINGLVSGYSYLKYFSAIEDFLLEKDEFEEYKAIVVALRLYTEYYELSQEPEMAKHIALLYKIQKKNELTPYFHYGFYKNDIFNFSIATPAFDYFENLSLSCFQIEVGNNSTNPVDFRRFKFSIHTVDGQILEEIDLERNKDFYNQLPPMPDGYLFEIVPVRETDRALRLFPIIKDESKISKVVMKDKNSNFKIEALFFENMY